MKRIVSLNYSSGRVMGVEFKPERRGKVYVGVALVDGDRAEKFEDRDDFEVEAVTADDAADFPDDFPLLAPQKAALVAAGLDSLEAVAAHDFGKAPVRQVGASTLGTLHSYLTERGHKPGWSGPAGRRLPS